ncbi:ribonuclease H-like domain-containing protein [Tanacetum coccineum]
MRIVDNIQADGATRYTSRLRFFHFSLKGKAKEWLDKIPATQITTWEQLVARFLDYFFLIGRTSYLRDMILRFKQSKNEPIKSAWIRFQDLIKQAPHHGIQKWLLVQIFHDNLSQTERSKLDQFVHFRFSSLTEEEGAHEADECHQNGPPEQVCMSGGDIYDDPSLLSIYQNDDIPPWGNSLRKKEGESSPDWVVRSKFKDELACFMLEKKFHTKGIGEMLDQHRKGMHEQFYQILSAIEESKIPEPDAPTYAITTRSGTSIRDPPFPTPPEPTTTDLVVETT